MDQMTYFGTIFRTNTFGPAHFVHLATGVKIAPFLITAIYSQQIEQTNVSDNIKANCMCIYKEFHQQFKHRPSANIFNVYTHIGN